MEILNRTDEVFGSFKISFSKQTSVVAPEGDKLTRTLGLHPLRYNFLAEVRQVRRYEGMIRIILQLLLV